jgi:hypothetical protein
VLLKEPKGRDVGEDDVFTINEAFKSKSIRVKLSAVSSQKEGDAEHIETRQKVRLRGAAGPAVFVGSCAAGLALTPSNDFLAHSPCRIEMILSAC